MIGQTIVENPVVQGVWSVVSEAVCMIVKGVTTILGLIW